MNKEEILETIRSLARSQGFYGRLLKILESDELDAIAYLDLLEEQHFKDPIDLILYLES